MNLPKVLYWSHAPATVYEVLRRCAAGVAELDTLETGDEAERVERLRDAQALIVAAYPFDASHLAHAPRLALVHHQGVGYHDTVPVQALAARGIRLALTPEGTTVGVAEHTVMLMLAVCKRLSHVDSELRQGRWHINSYRSESRELDGMTVGFVGFGRIGQAAALRLQAFGTRCVFHDPVLTTNPLAGKLDAQSLSLPQLLAQADIVSLHLPLTTGTRHLIDAAALAQMKRGAMLINASRGGLVDERALFEALASGHLAGAGLDCFEKEPPPPDHPLFGLHNVVLTPHTAAATADALVTKMNALFANLRRWQAGEALHNEVALQPAVLAEPSAQ